MPRLAAAVFLVLHGFAHVLGFLGSWRLAELRDVPYTTLVVNGAIDVGDVGIRIVGLLWLAAAAGFVVAGIAVWRSVRSALRITVVATSFSLVVCVLGLPASPVGVAIDVAVLSVAVALTAMRTGSFRPAVR